MSERGATAIRAGAGLLLVWVCRGFLAADHPALHVLLGLIGLAALAVPAPRARWLPFACLGFALALASSAFAPTLSHGPYRVVFARFGAALGSLAGISFALAWAWPWLREPIEPASSPPEPTPGPGPGTWAVLAVTALVHAAAWLSQPALVQTDSVVNTLEPPLLGFSATKFHHAPLYVVVVKACVALGPIAFSLLVAMQHALVVLIALGVERALRLHAGPWAGAAGGLVIGLDPSLATLAQAVMTEVPATLALLLAALAFDEALRRSEPRRWLLAAGALAATATLTKQALQAWWLPVALWILVRGPWRPRPRAAATFALAALAPIVAMVLHNLVFQGNARLTAATGRALLYRVVYDLPPLGDPTVAEPDEMERARRVVWAHRDEVWLGIYEALERELGWSQERIEAAVLSFYLERVRVHPARFAWITLRYVGEELTYPAEPMAWVVDFHEKTRPRGPPWSELGAGRATPAWYLALEALDLPRRIPTLILLALAPFLARPASRPLALLCLGTAVYLALVPAVAQIPVARFRAPAIPFVVIGALIGLASGTRSWPRSAPGPAPTGP